jgi:hypothetical protein
MERDFTNDWDDPNNPYNARQGPVFGDDPDYNGGVAPPPPAPRYDYNGGSPPDQALTPGHGWEWEGPQQSTWNADLGQWDRGVWQERSGSGLGYQAPAAPTGGGGGGSAPSGGGGRGAVPPINVGGNIPSATLPGNITDLFNKQPAQTPVQSAYQDALLKFMGRAQETPSLTDSTLSPQVEVFRVQQQRNQERNRRNVAERAAANNQSQSGFVDRQIDKGIQEQNFNTAAFNANLLGKEASARREELLAALQLARATGDSEAERELRARLAQVSAAMQQQGLNLQGQLGFGDLALRQMMAQMGNEQFYDQLGINTGLSLEQLNQNAVARLGF